MMYLSIRVSLIATYPEAPENTMAAFQLADVLSLAYSFVSLSLLSEAKRIGKTIIAWTVDDSQSMQSLMDMVEMMICTNRPSIWKKDIMINN